MPTPMPMLARPRHITLARAYIKIHTRARTRARARAHDPAHTHANAYTCAHILARTLALTPMPTLVPMPILALAHVLCTSVSARSYECAYVPICVRIHVHMCMYVERAPMSACVRATRVAFCIRIRLTSGGLTYTELR